MKTVLCFRFSCSNVHVHFVFFLYSFLLFFSSSSFFIALLDRLSSHIIISFFFSIAAAVVVVVERWHILWDPQPNKNPTKPNWIGNVRQLFLIEKQKTEKINTITKKVSVFDNLPPRTRKPLWFWLAFNLMWIHLTTQTHVFLFIWSNEMHRAPPYRTIDVKQDDRHKVHTSTRRKPRSSIQ